VQQGLAAGQPLVVPDEDGERRGGVGRGGGVDARMHVSPLCVD
jgi:hypothetical protein